MREGSLMAARGRARPAVTAGGTDICPKCSRRTMVINAGTGTCLHRGCEHVALQVEGWHCRWPQCQAEGVQGAGLGWSKGCAAWRHYMDNHHGKAIPVRSNRQA